MIRGRWRLGTLAPPLMQKALLWSDWSLGIGRWIWFDMRVLLVRNTKSENFPSFCLSCICLPRSTFHLRPSCSGSLETHRHPWDLLLSDFWRTGERFEGRRVRQGYQSPASFSAKQFKDSKIWCLKEILLASLWKRTQLTVGYPNCSLCKQILIFPHIFRLWRQVVIGGISVALWYQAGISEISLIYPSWLQNGCQNSKHQVYVQNRKKWGREESFNVQHFVRKMKNFLKLLIDFTVSLTNFLFYDTPGCQECWKCKYLAFPDSEECRGEWRWEWCWLNQLTASRGICFWLEFTDTLACKEIFKVRVFPCHGP